MDKLFEKYTINEISTKTHISPITLEKLKNLDIEDITPIKLNGFIRILESEYPEYDFSALKEFVKPKQKIKAKKPEEDSEELEHKEHLKQELDEVFEQNTQKNKINIFLVIFVLLILITGVVYYLKGSNKEETINKKVEQPIKVSQIKQEIKKTQLKEKNQTVVKQKQEVEVVKKHEEEKSINIEKPKKIEKKIEKKVINIEKKGDDTLKIKPQKLIWFKVFYFDTNKSKEYLTSHEIDLNGSRPIFMKLGHGFVSILYKDKNITPNNKRVFRVILKDGVLEKTNKRLREFLK